MKDYRICILTLKSLGILKSEEIQSRRTANPAEPKKWCTADRWSILLGKIWKTQRASELISV
jgi:hypothetical protein